MSLGACLDDKRDEKTIIRGFIMRFRISYAALTVCLFIALASCFERRAYAYIDPGSGLLACQAISAFCAGAIFYFRRQVRRVLRALQVPDASPKSAHGLHKTHN